MSPEAFSALFAGIAILVSVVAAIFAASSARSSKKSADAAEDQARISATEFAATAPLLDADFYGGRWTVTNDGGSTAYNVQLDCEPHGCNVMPELRTLPVGGKVQVFPRVHDLHHTLLLSWTRTPDGGPHDEPKQRSFPISRRDGQ